MDFAYYVALGITLIIAITVHEFAHAYVADQLGDDLPRLQGRITLNPLAHLDPLGSLMFVIAGFGWGKPVMTNPYRYRTAPRTGMAIVAAAGPLSNLLMAIMAGIPLRLGLMPPTFQANSFSLNYFLTIFVYTNVALMVFNLIPLAPLDGFKIALGVLPTDWADNLARIEQYGPLILMAIFFLGSRLPLFDQIIGQPRNLILNLILGPMR